MKNRLLPLLLFLLAAPASAQDWPNLGGNARRNGMSAETGPQAADLLWSNTDDFSIIAWHPFIEDGRVFTVREANFPQQGGAANDAIVAYDLDTGAELWRRTLAFGGDTSQEWIAWIAGVHDGRVFVSRGDYDGPQPLQALDAATGAPLWTSAYSSLAWAHDGLVFASDGDLILGDLANVVRIDAATGATVWTAPRSCPVGGHCGVATDGSAFYIDEVAPGGNKLTKFDLATGARMYSSQVMAGFTDQNTPFLGPDGTVYFSRTQNNVVTDFLFSFTDTGTGFVENWRRPVRWTTSHEQGLGPDGSIYTFSQADELIRLDPATGSILDQTGVLVPLGSPNVSPKTVVDAQGNVYISNGWANDPSTNARVYAYNAGLSVNLFTLTLDRMNAGGPVLGRDGTLVVADRSGVHAYRSACSFDVAAEGPGGGPLQAGAVNTFLATCATPGGQVFLAGGAYFGATPAPACGLSWNFQPLKQGPAFANGAGTAARNSFVPARAAGQRLKLQALDVATCTRSPVRLIQF